MARLINKLVHNPIESKAPIRRFIFDHKVWELDSGETVKVIEENMNAVIAMLNTYEFLQVLDADEEDLDKVDKFICQYCGRECKAKIGLISHEKACDKNPDNMTEKEAKKAKKDLGKKDKKKQNIKTLTPKAKLVPKGAGRSQKEDERFGNTDLAGVVTGQEKVETGSTGEKKSFSYDRDGVGWYGPGVEDDDTGFTASGLKSKNKNGNF